MQMRAISHIRGPALVVAGPGSGKTFVIVSRIYDLISLQNVSPDRILVLTFSKAAANEMKERFENAYSVQGVNFGTFHAAAYGFLKEFGMIRDIKLINESEKIRILKNFIKNHDLIKDPDDETILMFIEYLSKKKNCPKEDPVFRYSEELSDKYDDIKRVLDEYQTFIKDEGMIDFDDMIIRCIDMFKNDSVIKEKARMRFDHIIIDEFQDINFMQYEMIKILSGDKNNVFAVGDDDQSIYGFRGASYGIMKTFLDDNPGIKRYTLSENYRSKKRITEFASAVINFNKDRFDKEFISVKEGGNVRHIHLSSHREEEDELVKMIKDLKGEELKDTAVILRTNRDVALFSAVLSKNGIRVKERSASMANKEKKSLEMLEDIISFLNFVYKGQRRSDFIRFMNKPQRYIQRGALTGEKTDLKKIMDYYRKNHDMLSMIIDLDKTIGLCRSLSPDLAVSIFMNKMGYGSYLKSKCNSGPEYSDMINLTESIKKMISRSSVTYDFREILTDIIENKPTQNNDKNSINVITMHSSKGLEFKNVFLPDVNEGIIPAKNSSGRELEEECRLLYVALTRASDNLIIMTTDERNRDISRYIKKQIKRL